MKKFTGAILVVIIIFAIAFILKHSFMVNLSNHEQPSAVTIENTHSTSSRSAILLGQKIDINTATKDDLEALPGIGPSLAKEIVKYRKTHGRFKSIDELDAVKGIGQGKLANIKDMIVAN